MYAIRSYYVTHEAVEKEIIRLIDKNSFEKKISDLFGLTIKLTPKQKEFIENWLSLNLSLELIEFAYEKCVDSLNKLSFPYINKILMNWSDGGYQTKEQIIKEDKNDKIIKTDKNDHSYDLNEFYKLALNNTPSFGTEK